MYDEIVKLIKKEEFKIAEQKLNDVLNIKDLSDAEQAKVHFLIGYINTIYENKDKNEYIAKKNLLDNIKSDYSEPEAYLLYSKIEKDTNISINYLEDGLKKFNNHPKLLENLFGLVEDFDKEKILRQIDESNLVDYDLFMVIIEYLVAKEKWANVKKYSKKLLEHYRLSTYAQNYIELLEVYSNILGESEYDSDLIICKLQRIIKTDLDNDLNYSPYIAIVYEYIKKGDIDSANIYFDKIPINNKIEDFFEGPWSLITVDFSKVYKKIFDKFIITYKRDTTRRNKSKILYILYLYSPSEIYGIYRYNKNDLLTLSKIYKNLEFNMHIAIALYYMKLHFDMYDEAFETYFNILQNVSNFKGYTISSDELFEKASNELLIKMSERTKEFLNESEIYIIYHEELKEFIKDLVEKLFEKNLFKEIIKLIDYIPISILNKLNIAFELAYSYAEVQPNDKALKIYENILSIDPNNSSCLNNISLLYEELGDLDKAFENIKRAKQIEDNDINNRNYERIKSKLDKSRLEKREKENIKIQSICKNLNLDKLEEIGYDKDLQEKLNKISDVELKEILLRDLKECAYSVLLEQNKSAIIISGSIIEAILIYKIKSEGIEEYDLIGLRNRKKTCVKSIDSMVLDELLYVANKLKLLSDTNYYLSHFSREYRNVIHPNKEIRNKMEINKENANLMWKILKEIIYELL